jgi:hypothetical protein
LTAVAISFHIDAVSEVQVVAVSSHAAYAIRTDETTPIVTNKFTSIYLKLLIIYVNYKIHIFT